jgi:hypothetical protein
MKTDVVLTMREYLDMCCGVPKHVNPPARDAHHISITAERDLEPKHEARGCRCDRWGHPCPDCVERNVQSNAEPPVSTTYEKDQAI